MPLTNLQLVYLDKLIDLTPLRDLPLTTVNIMGCPAIKDTSVLSQIKTLAKTAGP
jgi:hypothetical protein